MANTLHKVERLDKKKIIEKMFAGGSRSFSVFPLRVVYLPVVQLNKVVTAIHKLFYLFAVRFLMSKKFNGIEYSKPSL
jgi:hypothetical protein